MSLPAANEIRANINQQVESAKMRRLEEALLNGEFEKADAIFKKTIDVNARLPGSFRETLLNSVLADGRSKYKAVKWLIEHKADVNGDSEGSPLCSSVAEPEIAEVLINANADVNAVCRTKDGREFSPLSSAALRVHCETMELLINSKADVNFTGLVCGFYRMVQFDCYDPRAIQILLDGGANPRTVENGMSILQAAEKSVEDSKWYIDHYEGKTDRREADPVAAERHKRKLDEFQQKVALIRNALSHTSKKRASR